MNKVTCDHCKEEILEQHATVCEAPNIGKWYYCLSCDLSFTLAAAKHSGVNSAISREQIKFICDTIRKEMKGATS